MNLNGWQKTAVIILLPIVVTLLMRLVFLILDGILNIWFNFGLNFLDVQWMFDIGENWVFWLASAVASLYLIIVILDD